MPKSLRSVTSLVREDEGFAKQIAEGIAEEITDGIANGIAEEGDYNGFAKSEGCAGSEGSVASAASKGAVVESGGSGGPKVTKGATSGGSAAEVVPCMKVLPGTVLRRVVLRAKGLPGMVLPRVVLPRMVPLGESSAECSGSENTGVAEKCNWTLLAPHYLEFMGVECWASGSGSGSSKTLFLKCK